jgi:hypothetical protein
MKILEKPWARYVIVLLVGIAVGAIFYPSKEVTIEEKLRLESEITKLQQEKRDIKKDLESKLSIQEASSKEYKRQTETRISSLKQENTTLKQKVKERTLKIVKPDGTIVEETVKESQTEIVSRIITDIKTEFNEKVQSIENKWKSIHEKRVVKIRDSYEKKIDEKERKIREYERRKTVKVNPRRFGLSLGYMGDDTYFSSIQYDIFGPMFLDLHFGGSVNRLDSGARNIGISETGIGIGIRF